MASSEESYRLFVGIDIAATTCAVAWMSAPASPTRAISIAQTPTGFAARQQRLLATAYHKCR